MKNSLFLSALCCLSLFTGYMYRSYTEQKKLYIPTQGKDISKKWVEVERLNSDQNGLYITQNDLVWRNNAFH